MEALQVPIVHLDEDGTILCWNPSAEQLLHLTVDLALGTDFAALLVPLDQAASFRARLAPALSGAGADVDQEIETELVDQKGRCFPAYVRIHRRQTARGRMRLVIVRERQGGRRPDAGEPQADFTPLHPVIEHAGSPLTTSTPGEGEPVSTAERSARERNLEPAVSALAAFVAISQLTRAEAALRAEVDRLRENEGRLSQTEMELAQLQEHATELRRTVGELQGELAALRDTEAELRAEAARRRESEARLQETADGLRSDLAMLRQDEARLRAEFDRLREKEGQLRQTELELTRLGVKLVQSEAEVSRLMETEAHLNHAEAELRAEVRSLREREARQQQTEAELRSEVAHLRDSQLQLTENEARLKQSEDELRSELAKVRETEAQLKQIVAELRAAEAQRTAAEAALLGELARLHETAASRENELTRLRESEAGLLQEEAELRSELARLGATEARRTEAEAALRGELAGLRETADTLQGEVTRLRVNEAGLRGRQKELQDDLGQLRENEGRLRAALGDSEMAQQKIRRRFQDQLQLLWSLLGLKKNLVRPLEAQRAFLENQQYLFSLLQLEDRLATAGPGGEIAIGEYLDSLVRTLRESYNRLGVWTKVSADPVALDPDRAGYLGLIVTELATNAFKHAFPGSVRDAEIGVTLKQVEDRCELCVWDTGVGLREVPELEQVTSPGWRLVHLLVTRLQGTVDVKISNGTIFRVTFPVPPVAGGRRAGRSIRRHPRFVVRRPIVCRPLGTTRYHPTAVSGELRDLSAGGAQIALPSPLHLSQQIDLVTVIDGESFRARADVVNADLPVRRDPKTGHLRHGVKWCSLDPATESTLAGILVRAAAAAPPADTFPGGDAASGAPPSASLQ